ncbi:PO113 protein, partial [Spizaetus tyrannus]|nr:PO113 protein [Spizaetus tyrannus]
QGQWIERPKYSERPLAEAVTVFTDAGKKSKSAAVVWNRDGQWQQHILKGEPTDSLQTLELLAVVWAAFRWLTMPLNIVTDSLYVAGIVRRIETAFIRDIKNLRLFELLR